MSTGHRQATRHRLVTVALAATALLAGLLAPAATAGQQPTGAGPPADYIAGKDQLSAPVHDATVTESYRVGTFDGEELYVEITRPDPSAHGEGPWPVILEASPYHGTLSGRDEVRIFPDPTDEAGERVGLTGYFAPRGYAVAIVDLRGTGKSSGCLDHLGPNDAEDLETVVEWAADQPWSTGEVGMTGHSYVGSTPSIAAAQNPDGLATIAPSAGLTSMYDHQFQSGVPYNLQWAGPMFAYEQLAAEKDLPGSGSGQFEQHPEQTGCGAPNSSLTAGHGQVTGQYQQWHAERDHRKAAARADIPVFMIHGVNDDAARIPAAEWFFGDRFPSAADKVWIGQWDHGSSNGNTRCQAADPAVGHVNCRFEQWQYALHAWFDKHLKHRDVDTGPTVEAFLNDDQVLTRTRWDRDGTGTPLDLYLDASDQTLSFTPPEATGSVSFDVVAGDNSVTFTSEPLDRDVTILGLPRLHLTVSQSTATPLHVVTTLQRLGADGVEHPMNFCAGNTGLRDSVATPSLIVPLLEMELDPQCFTAAHHLEAGERLAIEVGTSSEHHVATLGTDARVTVHTGPGKSAYGLPTVDNPTLHDDVPRFETPDGPDV